MKPRISLMLALSAFSCFALPGCAPVTVTPPTPEITIPKPPPSPPPAPAPTPDPTPYDPSGAPFGAPYINPTGLVVLAKKVAVPSDNRMSAFDERIERVEVNQAAADHRLDDIEARVDKLESPPVPVKSAEVKPDDPKPVTDPEASQKPFIAPNSPVAKGVVYQSFPNQYQCSNPEECARRYASPALPAQRYGSAATGRWFRFR